MVGSRCASIDLPVPGDPIMMTLWPPAAATTSARLANSWPRTSAKSTSYVFSRANSSSTPVARRALPFDLDYSRGQNFQRDEGFACPQTGLDGTQGFVQVVAGVVRQQQVRWLLSCDDHGMVDVAACLGDMHDVPQVQPERVRERD